MKKYSIFFYTILSVALCALVACEKPYVSDGDDEEVVVPGDDEQRGEVLWAENDTARFYLQDVEISGVVLADCPTPSALITDPRYRLPTRLEAAQVLKFADLPAGYWQSRQRILCVEGDGFSTSSRYYTYKPFCAVAPADRDTHYCIIAIRTEKIKWSEKNIDFVFTDSL